MSSRLREPSALAEGVREFGVFRHWSPTGARAAHNTRSKLSIDLIVIDHRARVNTVAYGREGTSLGK
jgi:hypothetical protein